MIFQGQEFFEDGRWTDAEPMDWGRKDTFNGIFQLYSDLVHLRRNLGGATRGLCGNSTVFHHLNDADKVGAWHRFDQGGVGDDVVVVTHWTNQTRGSYRIGFPREGTWYCVFNSNATAYDASFGGGGPIQITAEATPWDGMAYSATFDLPPYTALVFSQKLPDDSNGGGGPQTGPVLVDGQLDELYGDPISIQDTETGFGNSDLGLINYANGSEIDALSARVDEGVLYLMFHGNLESNFNKLDVFIDAIPNEGQNRLRDDNPAVKFGGLNRMGGDGSGDEPGLLFDPGFEPDFWCDFTCGGDFGTTFTTYMNWSQLLTDGGEGAITGFAGPGGPGAGQALFGGNGMIASIDNSNTGGVRGGDGIGDGSGVTTGVEFAIPLSVLGYTEGDALKVAAFVNGSEHNFVSNQVIGPLGGRPNLGEPRTIDFGSIPGDQFAVIVEGPVEPACLGDLDEDGRVDGSDFGSLLASWGSCAGCAADLDGSGQVDGGDVGMMLSSWGLCP